ncbi:MAG: exodeoxyribonuclease V subunit alpha [Thiomargarita sp.]|nr:exodeoxyribonuclease V subunit alpha [Thiomargarita sp.]
MSIPIEYLRDLGVFSDLDIYFAKLMERLSACHHEHLLLGAALASHFTTEGSSCVDLDKLAHQSYPLHAVNTIPCPSLSQWLKILHKTTVVGQPGDYTPLILDNHRLYLYRYWNYEQQLSAQIRYRIREPRSDVNQERLKEGLSRFFPEKNGQYYAALTAVQRHFCIISGGPGTGKTSTVVKILALLLEQNKKLSIALAAPTGKAAVRLQESITQALQQLNCAPHIKTIIPLDTYTIHRLLGSQSDSPYFRSHAGNLLPYDVVVIDEASMVDLALMDKLAQAIPKKSRWILLGDKDQLASVEAGTVLGDICEAGKEKGTLLQDSIVLLEKSYRFSQDSGIWNLAQAVKQGDSKTAFQILNDEQYSDVQWHSVDHRLPHDLITEIVSYFSHCLEQKIPKDILQAFEKFRILCASRLGRMGVKAVNRRIEDELRTLGRINTYSRWYHGRPIMISHNDYTHQLFNGDVGIILRNPEKRYELQAFFPDSKGDIRVFWPNRLPEHETVYAMTIHKSQGSEFDKVLMLLPNPFLPILSRELIYTGLTRAKKNMSIWGNESIFKEAISHKVSRSSGLREQLI